MGEEELKNQEEQSDIKEEVMGNAVKILREKYENTLRKLKELEEENKTLKEVSRVANLEEIASKVERLDFENAVLKKFPQFSEEIDEIWNFRKEGENIEDTIARYVGKKTLETQKTAPPQGYSLGSSKISPNLEEDLTSLPKEELEKRAREEFKKIYGRE